MTNKLSLRPVRRAIKESISTNQERVSPIDSEHTENKRTLRFENLEERRVLSVTGINGFDHSHDSGFVTTDFEQTDFHDKQDDVITYLKVLVNGETRELTPQANVLELVAGDTVEVVEIGFTSTELTGVYAAEGYVSKIGDQTSASLIDYNDGRFSGSDRDCPANGGDGVVAGLKNQWTVQAGWDRLTINLMHYTEQSTDVDGRFFVNLQI